MRPSGCTLRANVSASAYDLRAARVKSPRHKRLRHLLADAGPTFIEHRQKIWWTPYTSPSKPGGLQPWRIAGCRQSGESTWG